MEYEEWEEAIKTARTVARMKFLSTPPNVHADDLECSALFGAFDAMQRYDPEAGAVSTLVARRARGQIQDDLRAWGGGRGKSVRPMIPMSDVRSPELRPCFAVWDRTGEQAEVRDEYVKLMRKWPKLTQRERIAMTLFYLEGLSQAEIAEAMQCSVNNVAQLVKVARKRLRGEI